MARRALFFVAIFIGCATTKPSTPLFEFHNGFWMNLHDALYNEAHVPGGRAPVVKPLSLYEDEARVWNQALQGYRDTLATKEYPRDIELDRALDAVALLDGGADLSSVQLPAPMIDALRRAAPIYREHRWQETRRMNEEFIRHAKPIIAKHGDRMVKRLEQIFRDPWPRPARIDVVRYAMWAAAYTRVDRTGHPSSIVASDDEGNRIRTLEILFHEASHAVVSPRGGTVMKAINTRCKVTFDFWHALLFYSAGEAAKEELGPTYVPFADAGMWKIPSFGKAKVALDAAWLPYMMGQRPFEVTVGDICTSLGAPRVP